VVYLASANYDNREVVVECSAILRALNYTELSDRLEKDRSDAFIQTSPDEKGFELVSTTKWNDKFNSLLILVPGCHKYKGNDVKGRKVPTNQRDYLDAIVGYCFGGGGYVNDHGEIKKVDPVDFSVIEQLQRDRVPAWKRRRDEGNNRNGNGYYKRPHTTTYKPQPKDDNVYIEEKGDRFGVKSPFNREFTNDIKSIRGKKPHYDNGTFVCWSVPLDRKEDTMRMVARHYPNATVIVGIPTPS
jgi:hypothetical protein